MRITTVLVLLANLFASTASMAQPATNAAAPGGKVRLFLLDGQSNMAALKPEQSFTPTITKAFPGDIILVHKIGHSGQEIAKWVNLNGSEPKGIGYYRELIDGAKKLLDGRRPDSVCFVWMQGESDAVGKERADVYQRALRALIALVRKDIGGEQMPVVIGRINDWKKRAWNRMVFDQWDRIREIQVAVATADPNAAWVDTDDLNDPADDPHMVGKDGYKRLGLRLANACILLLSGKKPAGPVEEVSTANARQQGTNPTSENRQ
ncbi:MAG: sialate O-acetylesterase [Thermoguttaceae bacterium]|jgi:hypothetical protein